MLNTFKLPQGELAQAITSFKSAFKTIAVFSAFINMLLLVPSLYMLQVYDRVLASRNQTTLLLVVTIRPGTYVRLAAMASQ